MSKEADTGPDTSADTGDSAGGDTGPSDEVCNGKDDDLDGTIDEEEAEGCEEAWWDGDGDGYGGVSACVCPGTEGYVAVGRDCDDEEPCLTTECGIALYEEGCGTRGVSGYTLGPKAVGDFDNDGVVDSVDYSGRVIRTPETGWLPIEEAVVAQLEYPWHVGENPGSLADGIHDYDADGRMDYVRVQYQSTGTLEPETTMGAALVAWVPGVGADATVAWSAETPFWPSAYTEVWVDVVLHSDVDADGDMDVGLLQTREDDEGFFWLADEAGGQDLDATNALFPVAWAPRGGDRMFDLGDVNGDGADDLLWGEGVFHGPLDVALTGTPEVEMAGLGEVTVGGAIDLDGDGYRELYANGYDVRAQVAEIPTTSAAWSDQVIGSVVPDPSDWTVSLVGAAGDLNGDGGDELLISFGMQTPDFVCVWSGPLIGERLVSESAVEWSGYGADIYAMRGVPSTGEVAVWLRHSLDSDNARFVLLPY